MSGGGLTAEQTIAQLVGEKVVLARERDAWKALAEARGEMLLLWASRGPRYDRALDKGDEAVVDLRRLGVYP